MHADYSQRGAPIRISFFDDRIEVENPGILLPGMTIADMKQGISKIRNPVIARIFRELDLIEQWGSGVRRIFKDAQEMNLPEPQIVELGLRFRFIVPISEEFSVSTLKHRAGSGARSGAQSGARSGARSSARLTDKGIEILNATDMNQE